MAKDVINSMYGVGDTVKVVNPHSPYNGLQGVVKRLGTAGWRTSLHIDFPNMLTTRDVSQQEVQMVEKADPKLSPQVDKEPVRIEPAVDDQPRVIIPAPSVPAPSDVERDATSVTVDTDTDSRAASTTPTANTATAPKRRGRPKGSKNKPK